MLEKKGAQGPIAHPDKNISRTREKDQSYFCLLEKSRANSGQTSYAFFLRTILEALRHYTSDIYKMLFSFFPISGLRSSNQCLKRFSKYHIPVKIRRTRKVENKAML